MPLLNIFQTSPEHIYSLHIKQIVALCGDGKLLDGTRCSQELLDYLSQAPSEKLFEYIEACLQPGFENSGLVLQDLVNELGRRLDYQVTNGFYRGRSNAIGFDGIWRPPDGYCIVVEVKTTDTYRINFNTLAKYREDLIKVGKITQGASILVVVGRVDTGDLEAQVRGSKHAWDIRLISVDALIKLVRVKEETEEDTAKKIHELLVPFEYTKIDKIIEIAFTVAKDASAVSKEESSTGIDEHDTDLSVGEPRKQDATSPEILRELRQIIVTALGMRENAPLIRKSAALYWSSDRTLRVACTISKRYSSGGYWYGYHTKWDKFLSEGTSGFFALGCVGRNHAYAIPFNWIHAKLDQLRTTEHEDAKYWHIQLEETDSGDLALTTSKPVGRIPLNDFRIELQNKELSTAYGTS